MSQENTIRQAISDKVREKLSKPMCLIAVHFMPVDFDGAVKDGSEVWLKDITLEVPKETIFACATIMGVDISFGPSSYVEPRPLARLYYSLNEAKEAHVQNGRFKFTLSACLQDDKLPHAWSARIALQILCFGKP
jgi:hypothetical protein